MKPLDWKQLEYDFFHEDEVIKRVLSNVELQKMLIEIEKIRKNHYISLKKAGIQLNN